MKILVVSNIYPPQVIGGYELACHEAVTALREQRHEVLVITGRHTAPIEPGVWRLLDVCFTRNLHFIQVLLKELRNQLAFSKACREFRPDVIYFWNMRGASLSAAVQASIKGIPAVWYVFDNWLATPEMDHWRQIWLHSSTVGRRFISITARSLGLTDPAAVPSFSNVCFASAYLRDLVSSVGVHVTQHKVVPWGVRAEQFVPAEKTSSHPKRILYVGQIAPVKGVHTLIRAVGLLYSRYDWLDLSLTIVGDTELIPEYTAYLRSLAEEGGIAGCVTFAGKIPHAKVADLYRQHDILVFPSSWEEPFGITQLEGMASGLAVVGTATGGSAEILINEVNALVFHKEDAGGCARQINRLRDEVGLFNRLCEAGRGTVLERFTFGSYLATTCHVLEMAKWLPVAGVILSERFRTPRTQTMLPSIQHKIMSTLTALLFLAVRNFASRVFKAERMRHESPSILIVQMGKLSDVLSSLQFVNALRSSGAHVAMVVNFEVVPFLKGIIEADRIFPITYTGLASGHHLRGRAIWWLSSLWFSARYFWHDPPDAALSLRWENDNRQAVAATILHMSLSPKLFAFMDPGKGIYARIRNHFVDSGVTKVPAWDCVQRQRQLLAAVSPGATYELKRPDRLNTWLEGKIRSFLFAPGGGEVSTWSSKSYAELCDWLYDRFSIRTTVIAFKEDRFYAADVASALGGVVCIVSEEGEIEERLSSAMFCIGSDPSILTLAALKGIPYIYLCGPEDYRKFPVSSNGAIVRLDIDCSPCGGYCMLTSNVCMQGLSVERVKQTVAAILSVQQTEMSSTINAPSE